MPTETLESPNSIEAISADEAEEIGEVAVESTPVEIDPAALIHKEFRGVSPRPDSTLEHVAVNNGGEFRPAEHAMSKEGISQDELKFWIKYYSIHGSHPDWPIMDTRSEPGQLYIDQHPELVEAGLDSMRSKFALLEDIEDRETDNKAQEPACTICIPVAINSENQASVLHTLELIKSTADQLEGPVEVIIWANARYDETNQDHVVRTAEQNYTSLKEALTSMSGQEVQIKTALEVLPAEDLSMSKIRRNYMDAVLIEALESDWGYEHPVVWLDADTTAISKNSLKQITDGVRNLDGLFVHANVRFNADWASGKDPKTLDDATKAVVAGEIKRRQTSRNSRLGEYIEESGLAFALGTYARLNGVDTTDPVNESAKLIQKSMFMGPPVSNFPNYIPDYEGKRGVLYLESARIGTSARRHYELVKQKGAEGLLDPNSSNYDKTYSDMEKQDDSQTIATEQVKQYLGTDEKAEQSTNHTADQRRILNRVIERAFHS